MKKWKVSFSYRKTDEKGNSKIVGGSKETEAQTAEEAKENVKRSFDGYMDAVVFGAEPA